MTEPTDPVEMTPEQIAEANLLMFTKRAANENLIRFLNGMTTNALATYPEGEAQSWPYQKVEAEAILAAGEAATLVLAPFLTGVCHFQYGPADDATRLTQVKQKALVVSGNAYLWAMLSQFVNGLRARTQDLIEAADTSVAVNDALNAAIAEAEVFRSQAQL